MSQLDHVWQEPRPAQGNPTPMTENIGETRLAASGSRRAPVQLGVLGIAVVIAAGVVGWLLLRNHLETTAVPAPSGGPGLVSQAQLENLAASVDHPVYWAGPKDGYSYELTTTSSGRIWVRYLPTGTRAGDTRPDYLVVGTYAQPGSFAALKRAAKGTGSVSLGIPNDGLVVFSPQKPTSVYFSYPGARYQVEVYAPSGETARSLVLTGKIRPIK